MVKFYLSLCLLWIGMGMLEGAALIDASIDSTRSQAHFPLVGTITITHKKEEAIDVQSFEMEGKPLEVSFVKDVGMSASIDSDTIVSIYEFQLPAKEKGLYVLPSISVKIGKQIYRTVPSTYAVKDEKVSQPTPITSSSKESSAPIIFNLEAAVKGPTTLYPGERTKLFYRISYNRSVDLTRSVLPMIHPSHFQKVGDVQIEDKQLSTVTVQDLTQEVEASDLGTFSIGPSLIEGYAYTMKGGKKIYDSTLLKSEASALTLTVNPFPKSQQPPSFTGGLGKIKMEANLLTSPSMLIGDNLQLQVKVEGVTNLADLSFPPLQCQPGFSGFFQISDLPPLAEIKEKTKVFSVELRPLTSLINEIPPIEMSSFDPVAHAYVTQWTEAIPLKVRSPPIEKIRFQTSLPILIPPASFSMDQWPIPSATHLEIDDQWMEMSRIVTSNRRMSSNGWMLPLCIALLLLQYYLKNRWEKRPKAQPPTSEQLYRQALKMNLRSRESLQLLERAFWHRLWEKRCIPPTMIQLEQIAQIKGLEAVHSFIFQLQALQYGLDKKANPSDLRRSAEELFEKISC